MDNLRKDDVPLRFTFKIDVTYLLYIRTAYDLLGIIAEIGGIANTLMFVLGSIAMVFNPDFFAAELLGETFFRRDDNGVPDTPEEREFYNSQRKRNFKTISRNIEKNNRIDHADSLKVIAKLFGCRSFRLAPIEVMSFSIRKLLICRFRGTGKKSVFMRKAEREFEVGQRLLDKELDVINLVK